MQPFSNFGYRLRGIKGTIKKGFGEPGGKSINRENLAILNILGALGAPGRKTAEKIPFYRFLYRQGRRG